VNDRWPSSESTEFCRDLRLLGTERKPSLPRDVTGLDTLCGLVGLNSRLSDVMIPSISGRWPEGVRLCDGDHLLPTGSIDSLGVVGERFAGCAGVGSVSVAWVGLVFTVSMVMVGARGRPVVDLEAGAPPCGLESAMVGADVGEES
jgi:hypothetical protein